LRICRRRVPLPRFRPAGRFVGKAVARPCGRAVGDSSAPRGADAIRAHTPPTALRVARLAAGGASPPATARRPSGAGQREAAEAAVTWPWCSPRWPPSCPSACLFAVSLCALSGLCVEAVRAARRLPSPRPAVALGLPLRGCFRTDDHGLRASRGTRFGRTETGSETASKPAGVTGTPHAVAVLRYLVLRYRRETPSHFGKPQLIVCLRCAAHKIHLSERNFGALAAKT